MARHHRRTGLDQLLTWSAAIGAAAVVAVSFTMSLHALALLAERSGIIGTLRYGPPIAVDGLMLVAAVLWTARSRRGLSTVMARVVIAVSTTASILANATASRPGMVDPEAVNAILWGAMPGCLFVAWEMIMAIVRTGLDEHAHAVAVEQRAREQTARRQARSAARRAMAPAAVRAQPATMAAPALTAEPVQPLMAAMPQPRVLTEPADSPVHPVVPVAERPEPALAPADAARRVRAILADAAAAGTPIRLGEQQRVLAADPTLRSAWGRPDRAVARLISAYLAEEPAA